MENNSLCTILLVAFVLMSSIVTAQHRLEALSINVSNSLIDERWEFVYENENLVSIDRFRNNYLGSIDFEYLDGQLQSFTSSDLQTASKNFGVDLYYNDLGKIDSASYFSDLETWQYYLDFEDDKFIETQGFKLEDNEFVENSLLKIKNYASDKQVYTFWRDFYCIDYFGENCGNDVASYHYDTSGKLLKKEAGIENSHSWHLTEFEYSADEYLNGANVFWESEEYGPDFLYAMEYGIDSNFPMSDVQYPKEAFDVFYYLRGVPFSDEITDFLFYFQDRKMLEVIKDQEWLYRFHYDEEMISSNEFLSKPTRDFQVIPNPALDFINLSTDASFESLEIVNGFGQVMQKYPDNNTRFNIDQFPSGVYILKGVVKNGEQQMSQFVKL